MANPLRRAVNRLLSGAVEKALPDLGNVRGSIRDISAQVAAMREAANPGSATPLPRPPGWATAPFGPGQPLYPAPLDSTRPQSGRAEPRLYEYPVSWNLTGVSNRLQSWQLLRDAADGVSLFRRCIEIRKGHMLGLDWDVVIAQSAVEAAQQREGRTTGRADLEAKLREQLTPAIDKAVSFLKVPDRGNGYEFDQWLSMLLEESFVLDAVALYPRRTFGDDLWALEVLDGTTIKPLLDERGGRPLPPFPAFQQILYGFPRGEFTADTREVDGQQVIDGAYASDEMIYSRRVVRTWTPYGYSAVEQALDDGDLYLKRHRWMKGEYSQGTSVAGLFKIDPSAATGMWSPEQILQYERQLNDAYSGQLDERQKARILPPGVEPVAGDNLTAMAERYKPEYDLHLIKLLASHFDTTLPELGFTEAKGLGSEGYHEGQADVQHRKTRPVIKYVEGLLTGVLRRHLGMPPELQFKFLGLDDEDDPGADDVEAKRQGQGVKTLNERRDDLGLPRYDFAEADMPMIITARGVVFIEGSSELAPAGVEVDPPQAPPSTGQPGEPQVQEPAGGGEGTPAQAKPSPKPQAGDAAKRAEAVAYQRWMAKRSRASATQRPFVFEHLSPDELTGITLAPGTYTFKAGDAGPKAPAPPGRQWPGWEYDLSVVEAYAPQLRRALLSALRGTNTATRLARTWLTSGPRATEADPAAGRAAARAWLEGRGIDFETPLRRVLEQVWTEGYYIGDRSAAAMVAGLLLDLRKDAADYVFDVAVDWGNWKPGDARAARLILDAEGRSGGLIAMLDAAGADITSISFHRFDDLARVLHRSLLEGWSGGKLAKALRGVLDDPHYARMVATTETTRAVSQATLGRYRDNNVEAKEWMSAGDVRVCGYCNENEGDGAIALDAYFSSGNDAPPGHPDCRCALAPAIAARSDLSARGGVDVLPSGYGWGGLEGAETAGDLGEAGLEAEEGAEEGAELSEALDEAAAEAEEMMEILERNAAALRETMAAPEVSRTDLSSGAYGRVIKIRTEKGVYINKTIRHAEEGMEVETQQDAEQLAALVGRAFGLNTPAVLRLAPGEVAMTFAHGDIAELLSESLVEEMLASDQGQLMRLMDLVTNNRDRNMGNFAIEDAGTDEAELQLIDHGGAFQPWSAPDVVPAWPQALLDGWASDGQWVDNALSQGDFVELKRRLARFEQDFADLGRQDWYDAMLQRLDVLAQHATGTERIIW